MKMKHETENTVSDSCRLDIQELGGFLLRNNSGVDRSASRPVRYGLGHDSAEINKILKSSDLIGVVPVVIQPHHVGKTLGVALAVEAKAPAWEFRPRDKHAAAQLNFLNKFNKVGAVGCFVNQPGVLVSYIKEVLKI